MRGASLHLITRLKSSFSFDFTPLGGAHWSSFHGRLLERQTRARRRLDRELIAAAEGSEQIYQANFSRPSERERGNLPKDRHSTSLNAKRQSATNADEVKRTKAEILETIVAEKLE